MILHACTRAAPEHIRIASIGFERTRQLCVKVHEVGVLRIHAAHDVIEGGTFHILSILRLSEETEQVVGKLDEVVGAASLSCLSIQFLSQQVGSQIPMLVVSCRAIAVGTMLRHILPKVHSTLQHRPVTRELIFTFSGNELRNGGVGMIKVLRTFVIQNVLSFCRWQEFVHLLEKLTGFQMFFPSRYLVEIEQGFGYSTYLLNVEIAHPQILVCQFCGASIDVITHLAGSRQRSLISCIAIGIHQALQNLVQRVIRRPSTAILLYPIQQFLAKGTYVPAATFRLRLPKCVHHVVNACLSLLITTLQIVKAERR